MNPINVPYQDAQRRLLLALDDLHQAGTLEENSVNVVAYEILFRLSDDERPTFEALLDHFDGQPPSVRTEAALSDRDAWNGILLRVLTALGDSDPSQALENVRTFYREQLRG